jgi:16S rRNA processing protein RimM
MVKSDKQDTNHQPPASERRLIEMGVFGAPHGVRGQIKLRSYTEIPEDIIAYGPLSDMHGQSYTLTLHGEAGDMLIASVEGIADRNAVEKLKNMKLYVPRSALPKPKKGEYYHEDLTGLQVITAEGKPFGTILSVHNFGAGTLVNIALTVGGEEYMPFNPAVFPKVDIAGKTATIDPPFILQSDKEDE